MVCNTAVSATYQIVYEAKTQRVTLFIVMCINRDSADWEVEIMKVREIYTII